MRRQNWPLLIIVLVVVLYLAHSHFGGSTRGLFGKESEADAPADFWKCLRSFSNVGTHTLDVDNGVLSSVPEPGSILLLSASALVLLWKRQLSQLYSSLRDELRRGRPAFRSP